MERTAQEIDALIRRTPFMWPSAVIHAFVAGSNLHGAAGEKPGDLDVAGVYIQPVEMVLGIPMKRPDDGKWFDPDTQVWSTASDDRRNTAEDTDVSMYSLRKWAAMAASGSPTALEFLFAPNNSLRPEIWETYVRLDRSRFVSKRAGRHFLEYSKAMLRRILGDGTGKHGRREALIAEHGYDCKAAMHMLRVLGEGVELMKTGVITLPRPEAPYLRDVRNGKHPWEAVSADADRRLLALTEETERSFLPPEIDRLKVSRVVADAQLEFWGYA